MFDVEENVILELCWLIKVKVKAHDFAKMMYLQMLRKKTWLASNYCVEEKFFEMKRIWVVKFVLLRPFAH